MFIGVDTHKDTLAVSCVDAGRTEVAQQAFANTPTATRSCCPGPVHTRRCWIGSASRVQRTSAPASRTSST